ncbi:MAG: hypothetical protein M3Z27_01800 [Actinomycetota bacterium]|nr:hypothetical protein [Actinomycetota bacterium]
MGITAIDISSNPSVRYRECNLNRLAAAQVAYLRVGLGWRDAVRPRGHFDFSFTDPVFVEIFRRNIAILPVLAGPPANESTAPRHPYHFVGYYPPRSPAAFARFARAAARWYGPGGGFWKLHPELPYLPIRDWQIWNEPSLPIYWQPKPDAAAYTRLLRASARAIRSADPGADIVTAGNPYYSYGVFATKYLAAMYRAGAKGTFNTVGFHPYAGNGGLAFGRVAILRRLMNRYGDRTSAIWITEFGWASGGPDRLYTFRPRGQAAQITRFLTLIGRSATRLRLKGVMQAGWHDPPRPRGAHDWWGMHIGLLDTRGRAKPALAAFSRFAWGLNG